MIGHHASGTGGARHFEGSDSWPEWVGITSVPCAVTASMSARTTACAPPVTQPKADSELCTIRRSPGRTPRLTKAV